MQLKHDSLQTCCVGEKILLFGGEIIVCGQKINYIHRKHSTTAIQPRLKLNKKFTSALNYPLHNFYCKSLGNITLALAQQWHILYNYRTNSHRAVFIMSNSNSQNLPLYRCMTSHEQSIPDLSKNLSLSRCPLKYICCFGASPLNTV